jgi:dTDP-glucose 4,6-dehydratase
MRLLITGGAGFIGSNLARLALASRHASAIAYVTDRPGHNLRYAIDASRARAELGGAPQEDFRSGFRKTVRWYLDDPGWAEGILDGSYRLESLDKL